MSYAISNLPFTLRLISQHTAKNNTYETSFSNKQLFCVFSVFRGLLSFVRSVEFRCKRGARMADHSKSSGTVNASISWRALSMIDLGNILSSDDENLNCGR